MEIEQSVQLFVAINVIIIGLSHFLRPVLWISYFNYLSRRKEVGNILNAMMSLGLGSFILSFHFLWRSPMIVVTIYGSLHLLKGILYLIFPSLGMKSISSVDDSYSKFKWVGAIMVVFGVWILGYVTMN